MLLTGEVDVLGEKPVPVPLVHHNSHTQGRWIEKESAESDSSDKQPGPWQGCTAIQLV